MAEQRKGIISIGHEGLRVILQLPDGIDIERCYLEWEPGKEQELQIIVVGPGLPGRCILPEEHCTILERVHPRYRERQLSQDAGHVPVFDGLE